MFHYYMVPPNSCEGVYSAKYATESDAHAARNIMLRKPGYRCDPVERVKD